VENETDVIGQSHLSISTQQAKEGRVITSLGIDLNGGSLGLSAVSTILNPSDGSVIYSQPLEMTDGHLGSTERLVEAPENFYIYGFGFVSNSSGTNVLGIKIYVAKANFDDNTFETQECYATAHETACQANPINFSPSAMLRYREFKGAPSQPIHSLGISIEGNTTSVARAQATQLNKGLCY